jgi:hypothetical protein
MSLAGALVSRTGMILRGALQKIAQQPAVLRIIDPIPASKPPVIFQSVFNLSFFRFPTSLLRN